MNVGDKVLATKRQLDITVGKIYAVVEVDPDGDVFIMDDAGDRVILWDHEPAPVDPELAELRAFREQALARFPALAEPETDDEAADRFADDLDNEGPGEGVQDIILAAFAWARANPR